MGERAPPSRGRLWLFALFVAAAGGLLAWRWHNLQVERFQYYSRLAHDNQLSVLPVEPPRGLIYDRNGETLALNETVYSLKVGSDFAAAVLGNLDTLRRIIRIPGDAVEKLSQARGSRVYRGVITLREKLSEQEIADFLGWQFLFPEIVLESELARRYPLGDSAGHVIGHVGRLNDDDVKKLKREGAADAYRGAKFIGKTGVEFVYEDALRGALGVQEAQVDAHGRVFGRAMRRRPKRGGDLHLTLDMRLQRLAESLLAGDAGAAVMMDVEDGALLALASSPRFDVNNFVFGISPPRWRALNDSEQKPLIHRAIYGQYAPGSTIKPFFALAALRNGWRDENYVYYSRGFFRLGDHRFHDWKEGGHGRVGVARSIIRSVNTFYYELAHEVGAEAMREGLAPFGFGAVSGVDLDNEKGGVLPDPQWKKKTYGKEWFPGETISAGVGQGYVQATPLQMAVAAAMIANGGRKLRPYLSRDRAPFSSAHEFSPAHLQLVQDALAAVTRPGGTAPGVGRGAEYGIAGKTGTAQVSRLRYDADGNRVKNEDLPKKLRDHAWFVGYAPADAPRVAIAVMVENGGSGGRVAGPIARQMVDEYLAAYFPPPEIADADSEDLANSADAADEENADAVDSAATAVATVVAETNDDA
ncbi:MAG: penicillin-binding protein 2 [Gammaproteobacteria bacterium]